jgi:hypothetical protein
MVNMALVAHFMARDPGWWGLKALYDQLSCMAGKEAAVLQGLHQGFAEGAAPPQRMVKGSPQSVRDEATDTPGWRLLAVPEGATALVLYYEVQPQGDMLTFFPRASGAESAVEVAVLRGGKLKPVARLAGKPGVWSPISARWSIPLVCLDRDRPITFQVTLTGPWAQLWTRDKAAFFE